MATGHVAIMTEGTEFKLLFHFNLNNHMWVVAPIRWHSSRSLYCFPIAAVENVNVSGLNTWLYFLNGSVG